MSKRGPKPKFIDVQCSNEYCTLYGVTGKGNVIVNGTYMIKSGTFHKYICRNCGRVFCGRTDIAFYDLRTEDDKVLIALKMILKRAPMIIFQSPRGC